MATKSNARILLEGIVSEEYRRRAPASIRDLHKFFEFFSATQILKDKDLTDDEILSGIPIDNQTLDGGIDALYLFGNRKLLSSFEDFEDIVHEIELVIIQTKYTDKVPEEIIHKFDFTMRDFLDLSKSLDSDEMRSAYASEHLDIMQKFRDLYGESRSGVKIQFRFFVVHLADKVAVRVKDKGNILYQTIKKAIHEAEVSLDFLDPQSLISLVRKEKKQEFSLYYKRDIISPDEKGFICLVNLHDFYTFIHDSESNSIRENIFDANVRDYQGENSVNKDIEESIRNNTGLMDFWWLNNGVTMVVSKVTRRGDALVLENPEIVNGLQTSYTLHSYFSSIAYSEAMEKRHILVRIIQLGHKDEIFFDTIIRATNNQTPIAPLLLHATETIHHDIEQFFRKSTPPLYYERRKSYHKNKGRRISEIVDMKVLAQSVAGILTQVPNTARANIKSHLKSSENYNQVFSPTYPLAFFYYCAMLRKATVEFISSDEFSKDAKWRSLTKYMLYHIMMHATIMLTKNAAGPLSSKESMEGLINYANDIAKISPSKVTSEVLHLSADAVMSIYTNTHYGGRPNSAKIDELVKDVIDDARKRLRRRKD